MGFERDVLDNRPNWLMRKGNIVIALIFSICAVIALSINYNETITAKILVTSENPPVHLFSKKTGKIACINFEAGNEIKKNEILAVIENPSKMKDVLHLKDQLSHSLDSIKSLVDLYNKFPSNLQLDVNVHSSYQNFIKAFQTYLLYLDLKVGDIELQNLNFRTGRIKRQTSIKENQLKSEKRSYNLSVKKHEREKELFDKGVISKQQLDNGEQELLESEIRLQKIKEELQLLHIAVLNLENLGSKSQSKNTIDASSYISDLQLAKQELNGKIQKWESDYVFKSPISGLLITHEIWNTYQNVTEGEHVFTIVPKKQGRIIGKCKVPIKNSGRLKSGQEAFIQIDNYPSKEWGNLLGKVGHISATPKIGEEVYYTIYVVIPNLVTTYGKEIEFRQEMSGNARIVLKKTSLFQRMFFQFREIWENFDS